MENERILEKIQNMKDNVNTTKTIFQEKFHMARDLITEDDDYLSEMEEYYRRRCEDFEHCLQELEDLEFRIEEQKILQEQEDDSSVDSSYEQNFKQIVKKYRFSKCFFWE